MGARAGSHPLAGVGAIDLQKDKTQTGASIAQAVPVSPLERRAGQHHPARLVLQQLSQRGQPAFTVRIGQCNALAHLFAAGGAVVVVPFDQGQALGLGQGGTQARLAAARHAHDDHKSR